MALRSIWKGSLGFGMVAIPVKMYSAADDKRVGLLHNLHSECRGPLKQPKFCPQCNRQVEATEVLKGFQIDKEHYIPISEEELDNIKLESAHEIKVEGFIPASTLSDPRWFKDAYFLTADEVGVKAFVLFMKAMEAAGVVGISQITVREKEPLCAIQAFNGVILLQTLHWADELRDYSQLTCFTPISDREMEMAGSLIKAMTKDIDMASYHDEYRQALVELIEAKLEGKVIEAPKPKKAEEDLFKALEASLTAIGAKA